MAEARRSLLSASSSALAKLLERAAGRLGERLHALDAQLEAGAEVWAEYAQLAGALAAVLAHMEPGARGELLTTAQMAARLGVAPKTLLRHKAAGVVQPALQRGKLIRWRGDEVAR